MTAVESFALTLRRLREKSGHSSAHAFYKSQGGRSFFGCTYRQYLNVESAKSGPGPQLAARIAMALRLRLDGEDARGYFIAYLKTVVGRQDLMDLIVGALSGRGPAASEAAPPPLRRALVRNFETQTVPLSSRQSQCLTEREETYWVFNILSNDEEAWTVEALAEKTGYPEKAVKEALKSLLRADLASRDAQERYFCPHAGRVFMHPRDDFYAPRLEKLRALWARRSAKHGETIFKQHLFSRFPEKELSEYFPQLGAGVQAANICATTREGPDTGFFLIQTTVERLMRF